MLLINDQSDCYCTILKIYCIAFNTACTRCYSTCVHGYVQTLTCLCRHICNVLVWVVLLQLYKNTTVCDNSYSPSIVEQSQKGTGCSCIPLFIPCLWLCGISHVLCLLPSLQQCCWVLLFQSAYPLPKSSSVCPCSFLLNAAQLFQGFGLLQPL